MMLMFLIKIYFRNKAGMSLFFLSVSDHLSCCEIIPKVVEKCLLRFVTGLTEKQTRLNVYVCCCKPGAVVNCGVRLNSDLYIIVVYTLDTFFVIIVSMDTNSVGLLFCIFVTAKRHCLFSLAA